MPNLRLRSFCTSSSSSATLAEDTAKRMQLTITEPNPVIGPAVNELFAGSELEPEPPPPQPSTRTAAKSSAASRRSKRETSFTQRFMAISSNRRHQSEAGAGHTANAQGEVRRSRFAGASVNVHFAHFKHFLMTSFSDSPY